MIGARDDGPLVANARMYAVNPQVARAWQRLFKWVADEADVPLVYMAHAPPEPLETLWHRADLGCAFMCGYPLATWPHAASNPPRLLAAPLPSPSRYQRRPVYCTDIAVRADSGYTTIDELRGSRFGYTVEHSQSGWQAPRAFFARHARAAGGAWFRAVTGPLQTPRAVLDALLDGGIDAGPLDSWWHDLLRRHEPATAARLRVIATTPLTPVPPLVCANGIADATRRRLAAAFAGVADAPHLGSLRDDLLLHGFAMRDASDYATLVQDARETDTLGYRTLR
jgi:ABC-type phosphate/phosphonate transport system substrate-binding protein